MATKIILRQGDIQDLPILDAGELGYANNQQRLFVGNQPVTATVNADMQANIGVDLDLVPKFKVINGSTDITSTTAVNNNVLTLSNTVVNVGDSISVLYNTEVLTYQPSRENPNRTTKLNSSELTSWIFSISPNAELYDTGEIRYTITDDAGTMKRSGIISLSIVNDNYSISDNYITTDENSLPYEFDLVPYDADANPSTPMQFVLKYTTTNAIDGQFSYITNFWKS